MDLPSEEKLLEQPFMLVMHTWYQGLCAKNIYDKQYKQRLKTIWMAINACINNICGEENSNITEETDACEYIKSSLNNQSNPNIINFFSQLKYKKAGVSEVLKILEECGVVYADIQKIDILHEPELTNHIRTILNAIVSNEDQKTTNCSMEDVKCKSRRGVWPAIRTAGSLLLLMTALTSLRTNLITYPVSFTDNHTTMGKNIVPIDFMKPDPHKVDSSARPAKFFYDPAFGEMHQRGEHPPVKERGLVPIDFMNYEPHTVDSSHIRYPARFFYDSAASGEMHQQW
jgi:hypothetical protein